MKVLGVYDGHNAAVALVEDGKVLAVIEEERLSRIKFHDGRYDGMPVLSLREVLRMTGTAPEEIDVVAAPLLSPERLVGRVWADILSQANPNWLFFFVREFGNWGPLYYFSPLDYQQKRKKAILKFLADNGLGGKRIEWTEHHHAHNASAYYTSGLEGDALAVCFDGKGDGLSGELMKCSDGTMESLHRTSERHSLAMLYSAVTEYLGFRPMRHEGKITGLAAFAKPENPAYYAMKDYAVVENGAVRMKLFEKLPIRPYPWMSTRDIIPAIKRDLGGAGLESAQVASAVQKISEDIAVGYVSHWVKKTGIGDIVLSGGLFSNVKINMKVMEIPEVESIFIHPAMGDGGLALGAALIATARERGLEPFELKNVYFGAGYSDAEIEAELSKHPEIEFSRSAGIARETASLTAEGKVVARFDGRMEYGPRALGNRSILYDPSDPSVNKWLNDRLNRTEFMPFAPVAMEEHAEELYLRMEKARYAARFMTIALDTTEFAKEKAAAVTHVDGTARPQLVKPEYNETYYNILKGFYGKTGTPCMVNTSFNMHEEPIVGSPYDAVRSFLMGRLDVLSIGGFIATMKEKRGRAPAKKLV